MARKQEVTLDDVRATAERLRGEDPRTDISARDIIDLLGRGSAGVVNAHLREVKVEWIQAEKYQYLELSPMLRAYIFAEVSRAAREADNAARRECNVTVHHWKKVIQANEVAERQVAALETELAAARQDAAEKISRLEAELAETRGRLIVSEEVRSTLAASLQEAHEQSRQVRSELEARIANLHDRLVRSAGRTAVAGSRPNGKGRPKLSPIEHTPTLFSA